MRQLIRFDSFFHIEYTRNIAKDDLTFTTWAINWRNALRKIGWRLMGVSRKMHCLRLHLHILLYLLLSHFIWPQLCTYILSSQNGILSYIFILYTFRNSKRWFLNKGLNLLNLVYQANCQWTVATSCYSP